MSLKLGKLERILKNTAKVILLAAGLGLATLANASTISGDAYPSKDGYPRHPINGTNAINITNSRNSRVNYVSIVNSTYTTSTRTDSLEVGDTIYIRADFSDYYHFKTSDVITSTTEQNHPPAIVFAIDTSSAFSASFNYIYNQSAIPDTSIWGFLWTEMESEKIDSARVKKYYPHGGRGIHFLVLGVEGDSVIMPGRKMHYELRYINEDTTFRTRDSVYVNTSHGNAVLIDTVDFPRDTIIDTTGVQEQPTKIKKDKPIPSVVSTNYARGLKEPIYNPAGQRVNPLKIRRGPYFVRTGNITYKMMVN